MPLSPRRDGCGDRFRLQTVRIIVGPRFRALEAAWIEGVAAMAHAGARIMWMRSSSVVRRRSSDGRRRWARCRCCRSASGVTARSPSAGRSRMVTGSPGRRHPGQNAVHQGVAYDLQVDTTHTEALECARERRLLAVIADLGGTVAPSRALDHPRPAPERPAPAPPRPAPAPPRPTPAPPRTLTGTRSASPGTQLPSLPPRRPGLRVPGQRQRWNIDAAITTTMEH